jgi:hypothetical protein
MKFRSVQDEEEWWSGRVRDLYAVGEECQDACLHPQPAHASHHPVMLRSMLIADVRILSEVLGSMQDRES